MSGLLTALNPVSYLNNIEFGVVLTNLQLQLASKENLPMNLLYVVSLVVVYFGTKKYLSPVSLNKPESAEPKSAESESAEPKSIDVISRALNWGKSFFTNQVVSVATIPKKKPATEPKPKSGVSIGDDGAVTLAPPTDAPKSKSEIITDSTSNSNTIPKGTKIKETTNQPTNQKA